MSCQCKTGCKTAKCGCRKKGIICNPESCKCKNCCNIEYEEMQKDLTAYFEELQISVIANGDNASDNVSSTIASLKDLEICNCKTLCENLRCYCRKNGRSCDIDRCGCCTKVRIL